MAVEKWSLLAWGLAEVGLGGGETTRRLDSGDNLLLHHPKPAKGLRGTEEPSPSRGPGRKGLGSLGLLALGSCQ